MFISHTKIEIRDLFNHAFFKRRSNTGLAIVEQPVLPNCMTDRQLYCSMIRSTHHVPPPPRCCTPILIGVVCIVCDFMMYVCVCCDPKKNNSNVVVVVLSAAGKLWRRLYGQQSCFAGEDYMVSTWYCCMCHFVVLEKSSGIPWFSFILSRYFFSWTRTRTTTSMMTKIGIAKFYERTNERTDEQSWPGIYLQTKYI